MRVETLAVVAAALLGLSAVFVSTATAKRPLCKLGRFLVQGERLITPIGSGPQPVVVGDGKAAIDDICPPIHARLTRSKQGTAIAAKWPACSGVEGRVRIKGTLDPACESLRGRLTAKKADLRQEFSAARSACGDQVFDPSGGEICDGGLGCGADEHCTPSCACEPGAATTTTTVSTVPTTTTTCAASVAFDGATASDYVMFSGMETATEGEYDETSHCHAVTSPVRSGSRACQIDQGFFSAVRPGRFAENTIFVRVYHRIDVITPPSQLTFEPVIIIDHLPQGITAVDVGVGSDGTIRYALRNRINTQILGVDQPLAAGVWRRIELRTTIGSGTGSAEVRIDGAPVPVLTVSNQDFRDLPLDSVFISHNPDVYEGAHGGVWTTTYDDIAVTRNHFPGAGRVIARQGRVGASSSNEWTLVGTSSIAEAWSDTPADGARRAETPAVGDPLAQTMLVAPFGQGVDPICVGNVVKACQVWLFAGLNATPADRSYATRRRIAGTTTDVPLPGQCGGADTPPACFDGTNGSIQSDALQSTFWSATLDELNAAEIGAVKSGGAGGAGLRVPDAWLSCEYQ